MNALNVRMMTAGLLILLTLTSGIWLSHLGKPLNTIVFTIHKLIALAFVILMGMVWSQFRQTVIISPLAYTAILISGLLYLLLFVSGALLSVGKPASGAMLLIHQVAPLLAAASTAFSIYLLLFNQQALQ